jgi:hypothetical protein
MTTEALLKSQYTVAANRQGGGESGRVSRHTD